MKCQRRGSNLRVDIKLALLSLNRGTDFPKMTIENMEAYLKVLRKEQREKGIIK